jgi:hypothetical protein
VGASVVFPMLLAPWIWILSRSAIWCAPDRTQFCRIRERICVPLCWHPWRTWRPTGCIQSLVELPPRCWRNCRRKISSRLRLFRNDRSPAGPLREEAWSLFLFAARDMPIPRALLRRSTARLERAAASWVETISVRRCQNRGSPCDRTRQRPAAAIPETFSRVQKQKIGCSQRDDSEATAALAVTTDTVSRCALRRCRCTSMVAQYQGSPLHDASWPAPWSAPGSAPLGAARRPPPAMWWRRPVRLRRLSPRFLAYRCCFPALSVLQARASLLGAKASHPAMPTSIVEAGPDPVRGRDKP